LKYHSSITVRLLTNEVFSLIEKPHPLVRGGVLRIPG